MHRWILIAFTLCAVAACDDGPTSPSDGPIVFSSVLRPSNEVPAVTNAESSGTGAVQISFNVIRDAAGAVTAATADIYFQYSGFPSDIQVRGAHIHTGVAGVNGGILVDTGLTPAAPFTTGSGSGEFRVSGITVAAGTAQNIINNPSAFYFNIHSPLNTGGFARGQLTRIQ